MIRIRRNSGLAREVVRGAGRNETERCVVTIEPVDDFIERSIAPHGADYVGPARGRLGRERRRVAGLERHAHIDAMAALAHPPDHVAEIGAIGARAVNDENDVLARHLSSHDRK
jgi:hypothetical protein